MLFVSRIPHTLIYNCIYGQWECDLMSCPCHLGETIIRMRVKQYNPTKTLKKDSFYLYTIHFIYILSLVLVQHWKLNQLTRHNTNICCLGTKIYT